MWKEEWNNKNIIERSSASVVCDWFDLFSPLYYWIVLFLVILFKINTQSNHFPLFSKQGLFCYIMAWSFFILLLTLPFMLPTNRKSASWISIFLISSLMIICLQKSTQICFHNFTNKSKREHSLWYIFHTHTLLYTTY